MNNIEWWWCWVVSRSISNVRICHLNKFWVQNVIRMINIFLRPLHECVKLRERYLLITFNRFKSLSRCIHNTLFTYFPYTDVLTIFLPLYLKYNKKREEIMWQQFASDNYESGLLFYNKLLRVCLVCFTIFSCINSMICAQTGFFVYITEDNGSGTCPFTKITYFLSMHFKCWGLRMFADENT